MNMIEKLSFIRPLPEGDGPDRGVRGLRRNAPMSALIRRIPLIRPSDTFSLGEKEILTGAQS